MTYHAHADSAVYAVRHVRTSVSVRLYVRPSVLARANGGDIGARNNICIAFGQAVQDEYGGERPYVIFDDLDFTEVQPSRYQRR